MDRDETQSSKVVEQAQQIAQHALNDSDVPNFYINGFINGVGFGDSYLILQNNGKTTAIMTMSLATLKTLTESLTTMVSEVEKQLDQEILTIQQIRERLTG